MAAIASLYENATNDLSGSIHGVLLGSQLCRDRNGYYNPSIYNALACAFCFIYVFADYNVSFDFQTYGLVTGKNTVYPEGTRLDTDVNNSVSVSMVCRLLQEPSECWKWQACCRQARDCCQRQIRDNLHPPTGDKCPATWDGYACWPETTAGHRPVINCPSYVPHANTARHAYKTCTLNATWLTNRKSKKEWTDYTDCFSREHFHRLHTSVIACSTITIALLLPACIILLYYRPLRQQHRIRLHICLMASSFLTSVCSLLWEILVFKDSLESSKRLHDKSLNSIGCRLLVSFIRYAEQASFMWMFMEGFHLHRLLVRAFSVPKTLFPYYIFGFGFPLLPVTLYAVIRGTHQRLNQNCWIERADGYEWIFAVPSLIILAANVVFLLRIVYIMVRQLEPHPNEPSNFRRAVKAVVVLVPVFGIQFLFFIYRPEVTSDFHKVYELLSKIFSSLQGSFVAMVFCYFSKEVQGYLKTSCMRPFRKSGRHDNHWRSLTMTTNFPTTEPSRTGMSNGSGDTIPLQAIDPACHNDTNDKKTENVVQNNDTNVISESMEGDFLLDQK